MNKTIQYICGFWIIFWLLLASPFFLINAFLHGIAGFGAFMLKDAPDELLLPNWMKKTIFFLDTFN